MIISFTTLFAIVTAVLATSVLVAATALLVARHALAQARTAAGTAEMATLRMAEMRDVLDTYTVQLETLLAERERERAAPARPSLREAVALSRHGASTDELVTTCRIGQGEARLIQMLYGASRRGADDGPATGVH